MNDNDNIETTREIHEQADKYKLKVKAKRGTGTNDRDEATVTVRAETLDELEADAEEAMYVVRHELAKMRDFQPDEDD